MCICAVCEYAARKKNLSRYMKLDLMVEAYPFEYLRGTVWIVGEGNGNPLQYSCLQNSMDRGAWLAAVHGVTQSWT